MVTRTLVSLSAKLTKPRRARSKPPQHLSYQNASLPCWGIKLHLSDVAHVSLTCLPLPNAPKIMYLKPHDLRSKNQLLLLPPPPLASCACSPFKKGRLGPPPLRDCSPPPPRRGFAIREPAPPKLKPPDAVDEVDRPRVEPSLAASSRSLTAEICASNLRGWSAHHPKDDC